MAAPAGGAYPPASAAGAAAGYLPMDMNNMAAFNPQLYGFPFASGGSMGGAGASWFPANASSFHAPGAKNEIKLFVGGLQF